MSRGLDHGERNTVRVDGDELEVYDHVTITQEHYVNSVNGYETFNSIAAGDGGPFADPPEAVTERVARLLYDEFSIEVDDRGIRVVDMSRDDVEEA